MFHANDHNTLVMSKEELNVSVKSLMKAAQIESIDGLCQCRIITTILYMLPMPLEES